MANCRGNHILRSFEEYMRALHNCHGYWNHFSFREGFWFSFQERNWNDLWCSFQKDIKQDFLLELRFNILKRNSVAVDFASGTELRWSFEDFFLRGFCFWNWWLMLTQRWLQIVEDAYKVFDLELSMTYSGPPDWYDRQQRLDCQYWKGYYIGHEGFQPFACWYSHQLASLLSSKLILLRFVQVASERVGFMCGYQCLRPTVSLVSFCNNMGTSR